MKRRVPALLPLLATGCGGVQSTLEPHGPGAESIAVMWWVMLVGSAIVLGLVMVLAWMGVDRRRRPALGTTHLIAAGGLLLPAVTLTVLLFYGLGPGAAPHLSGQDGEPLRVEVIGHRWFWEVRYPGANGLAVTANEIHIPVGRPVEFQLHTADVIHSFWVPNLGGKMDMIPGRTNRLILRADRPGRYRGQCAEFCGAQHARMAFWVVAQPQEEFARWLALQRTPARPAEDAAARRGWNRFVELGCIECHTIRGTQADGRIGPDLTHVASRSHIAAGTLPTSRESFARWITDNQRVKPGNRMEDFSHIPPEVVRELVAFLVTLQ